MRGMQFSTFLKIFYFNCAHLLQGPSRLELSKPLIAAVSGFAVAGGLELALLADLRVVEESAVMGVFCRRFGTSPPTAASSLISCSSSSKGREKKNGNLVVREKLLMHLSLALMHICCLHSVGKKVFGNLVYCVKLKKKEKKRNKS